MEDKELKVTSLKEEVKDAPEFGNMTDVAFREHLRFHPETSDELKFNGFTVKEWKEAMEFNMTPLQLKEYRGK